MLEAQLEVREDARRHYRSVAYGTWKVGNARKLFTENRANTTPNGLRFIDEEQLNGIIEALKIESSLITSTSLLEILKTNHLRKALCLGTVALQLTVPLWPIIYFTTDFLRRANISYELAERVTSASLFISTIATFFGMFLVERFSRRVMFLTFSLINILSLVIFVISEISRKIFDPLKYGCIISLIVYGIAYSIATGPIAWFITAELTPLSNRSLLQSAALSLNQLAALALCFVTFPLYSDFGSIVFFPLFIVPGFASIIYLYLKLPETKNREITDIINDLKQFNSSSRNNHCLNVIQCSSTSL